MENTMRMDVTVSHLRCEYLVDPLGIDESKPRLSWVIETLRRGARQAAWRVRVASSAQALAAGKADLWDSGRVEDDRTLQIVYAGVPLTSRMRCYWQVQVWDEKGDCAVSEPAFWSMGLLEARDWQAKWIMADASFRRRANYAVEPTQTEPGTPPWLRKEFAVKGEIRRATVYASARGLFELHLNGRKVRGDVFAPEWTDYDKRIQYRTYDVSGLVQSGSNAIGAALGDGWYSGFVGWQETRCRYGQEPSLLVQLEIELTDGSRQVIGTDGSWKCSAGPIMYSDFMMGEMYDARRELRGWDRPGYDDAGWTEVCAAEPCGAVLVTQRSEPVRQTQAIEPVSMHEVQPGRWIFDLGQNISGWVRLRASGPAGTRVTLRHGERLNPDGTLYTENLRRAKATDVYVFRGDGEETWEPRFTFHGFQYVELSGLEGRPAKGTVTGCVIGSDLSGPGHFECSHAGVNRLWLNALWGQKGNFLSVPTDCPQRDERLGWMGDAQVFLRTALYNMDGAAFFTKWMVDVEDAQTSEGIFPDTAPRLREDKNFVGLDGLGGAAGWADAGVVIPWTLWRVYGDVRIIERHYPAMKAWLDYIERTNPTGIRRNELGNNYGDWLCIPSDTTFRTQSPMKTLLATAYWADDAAKLAQMAEAIGRREESQWYRAVFERVRAAFQKEFVLEDGRLAVETQTAYLLALAFDLLPEGTRGRAADHLVENIKNLGWHLSTGFIGIRLLNPVLTEAGRGDVAWQLLLNEDYPSWLYPVWHGATTIWERWNGWTAQDGFFNPQMNSFNHYSLGSVGEWLFRFAAGIELDAEVNGFGQIVIRPYPGGGLGHAAARYWSIRGLIQSRWQREDNRLKLNVTIPANTTARIFVPSDKGTDVLESGVSAEQANGVERIGRDGMFTVFRVQSGAYEFTGTYSG